MGSNKTDTPAPSASIDAVIDSINFNDQGLVAAIAQQSGDGEILMMAWMNADAIRETLSTGTVCYFSRSREKLWRKGETSGQTQKLVDFRWDCDGDTILLVVEQIGVACHTGRRNCFFNALRDGKITKIADVITDPKKLYDK
ncbi:MAG: phosphoribosyl-AMP cyclohydrolase [Rhodospirillaceae bacterium]|nr:phosphoribosyl-AMP cyclohydrolase [Rhodospirillaceae bacterium]